jgi:hypothetical protein
MGQSACNNQHFTVYFTGKNTHYQKLTKGGVAPEGNLV